MPLSDYFSKDRPLPLDVKAPELFERMPTAYAPTGLDTMVSNLTRMARGGDLVPIEDLTWYTDPKNYGVPDDPWDLPRLSIRPQWQKDVQRGQEYLQHYVDQLPQFGDITDVTGRIQPYIARALTGPVPPRPTAPSPPAQLLQPYQR